jgi:hypothetical protein
MTNRIVIPLAHGAVAPTPKGNGASMARGELAWHSPPHLTSS